MRNLAFAGVLAVLLIGFAGIVPRVGVTRAAGDTSPLPDFGAAPELLNKVWLNTDKPLRLATLRGQVVLIEFWTFGCINCIHTLPYVQDWYAKYQSKGLTVIGNHFPEFGYERDIQNVAAALKDRQLTYPNAQDNAGETWAAYRQLYWPTIYLIDKVGHIRYRAIGEGNYDLTENAINELLAEPYTPDAKPATLRESYVSPIKDVQVYRKPATDSEVLGSVRKGMAFVVLESSEGWHKISYNDGEGYIAVNPEQIAFVAGTAAN